MKNRQPRILADTASAVVTNSRQFRGVALQKSGAGRTKYTVVIRPRVWLGPPPNRTRGVSLITRDSCRDSLSLKLCFDACLAGRLVKSYLFVIGFHRTIAGLSLRL